MSSNYPPGVGANTYGAPWNEPEGPCDVCGQPVDECVCPECPICGGQGDPVCYEICPATGYPYHGLTRSLGQVALRAAYLQLLEDERNADDKYRAMIDTVDGGESTDE